MRANGCAVEMFGIWRYGPVEQREKGQFILWKYRCQPDVDGSKAVRPTNGLGQGF